MEEDMLVIRWPHNGQARPGFLGVGIAIGIDA
jgi:hypothetical protein